MMERKKKRGVTAGEAGGQLGDAQSWHKEVDQQENAKKHAVAGGSNSDSFMQPSFPSSYWSYAQQLLQQTMQQQSSSLQQQGVQQQSQNPELSSLSSGAGLYPLFPGSSEMKLNAAQVPGSSGPPYNNINGLGFPPPPFPGMWDPMSMWMHHTHHHQAMFPYLPPGFGYSTTPLPVGGNQRGFIKLPPGLSRKHQRLWEAQSMENVQLWATTMQLGALVARTEAEISCQRAKILKLECDLLTIKAQCESMLEASIAAPAPQPARRARGKKTASAPVAIVGLPASQSAPAKAQGKRAKPMVGKVDFANNAKEDSLDEKPKITSIDSMVGAIESFDDQDQKGNILIVGLTRDESEGETASHTHTLETEELETQTYMVSGEKCSFNSNCLGQSNSSNPTLPIGAVNESSIEPNMDSRDAPIVSIEKQDLIHGDSTNGSPGVNANAGDGTRNTILGGMLKAQFGCDAIQRSNASCSGQPVPAWQYPREDGSVEHDDVTGSGQDDDVDDEEEAALDDINDGKLGTYIVLEPASAIPKEMTALGRW